MLINFYCSFRLTPIDEHQSSLEKLWRLCETTVKVNDKYTLIKQVNRYTNKIKVLFEGDVRCDNLCIHPKRTCSLCRRKMKRCKSELWNVGKISTKQKNTTFQENSDVCLACEKKSHIFKETIKK